jgi:hypothetical protein
MADLDPIALAAAIAEAESAPQQAPAPERGFLAGIVESVTGAERTTPEIEGMKGWQRLPELNRITPEMLAVTFGGALAQTDELAQIIQQQFPGVKMRRDDKGNYIFRSAIDGQEYAIKPGVDLGDIPRALYGIMAFTPAGRAKTLMGGAIGAAGTEAAIQTGEAAAGGEFDVQQIPLAGATEAGGRLLFGGLSRAMRGPEAPPAPAPSVPAAAAPAMPPAAGAAMPLAVPPAAGPRIGMGPTGRPTLGAAAMTAEEAAEDEFRKMMRRAALGGAGSQAARESLAKMAVGNPEVRAAAERLGIDMPPDVWSDHTQLRSAIGLARSQIGSAARRDWEESLTGAVRRADDALEAIDASPDLSLISDNILRNIEKTRADLKREASGLYRQVDAAVRPGLLVDPTNSVRLLNARISELGGAGALRGKEKELFDVVTDPDTPMTYARLVTLKQDVGRALEGRGGPYTDVNEAVLKRVYGALAEDQLAVAGSVGGDELRQILRLANQTTAKQKALEKRIVNAFGKDLDGSIATALRVAIMGGRSGDISGLNRVLKTVPKELQRETVASAISALSRSRRALSGGLGEEALVAPFSFAEYTKLYRDLRQNSLVYKKIADVIGPDGQKVMRDLYEISRYVNDASERIIRTGAANQALLAELNAQGPIAAVMNTTLGRRATEAATGAAGAAIGSPMIGAAGGALVGALAEVGRKDNVRAMGDMFASDAFKDLVAQAAAGNVTDRARRRVLADPVFRRWAKINNVENPSEWLSGALQGVRRITTEEEQ